MALTARRVDPARGMKFRVSVPEVGLVNLGFSKISGLAQESERIEYREGNEPPVQRQQPGLVKTPEVSLERGVATPSDLDLLLAWRELIEGITSEEIAAYHSNVEIMVMNRAGGDMFKLELSNAYPLRVTYGDLDANASEVWLATLVFVHEGMIRREVGGGPAIGASLSFGI